jgi:hypothetical protein
MRTRVSLAGTALDEYLAATLLGIRADINRPDLRIFPTVEVHYEPEPVAHTTKEIEQLKSYCVGGCFPTECGETLAQIMPPPQAGSRYLNIPASTVITRVWVVSEGDI